MIDVSFCDQSCLIPRQEAHVGTTIGTSLSEREGVHLAEMGGGRVQILKRGGRMQILKRGGVI